MDWVALSVKRIDVAPFVPVRKTVVCIGDGDATVELLLWLWLFCGTGL
jgi:hypothetical protein